MPEPKTSMELQEEADSQEILDIPSLQQIVDMEQRLNIDQQNAYLQNKNAYEENRPQVFFIHGLAGTYMWV